VSRTAGGTHAPAEPVALAHRIAELLDRQSAGCSRPLVALDHDGTLSPIAPSPALARLAPGADGALLGLCEVADVVIVSGRGLDDLIDRFAGVPVELVAEHGLRHRAADGTVTLLTAELDPMVLASLRGGLATLIDAAAVRDGWLVEDKGVSIAVHHRAVPDERREPTLSRLRELLTRTAAQGGRVQDGKAVLELRPAGADKGSALRALREAHGGAVVVMIGDDVTDEPALALAESTGGLGILVSEEPRATAASARLTDPGAVVALLTELPLALRPAR